MKQYNSLLDIKTDLNSGAITCVDLVTQYLLNIESQKDLNAFIEVYSEEALAKAEQVDSKIKDGSAGKLAGMVIGLKDVLCHKEHKLGASSKILDGFESQFSGTAVERIIAEDAIIIGRQSCDEFAMGSSNETSIYGKVKNAKGENKVPGGSSGASAVAVQANMCLTSLGSDTGGSVRQPASFCGIYGFKPTYSRISRHGLIAYASSFDSIGIFSKSISDNALVLSVIAGKDEFDSTVSQLPVPDYSNGLKKETKKLKIAYLESGISGEGLQPEVAEQTKAAIEKLKKEGHTVEPIKFDFIDYILPTYYILTTAEASSNLSRFDGVRYGHRSENSEDLEGLYKNSRSEGFGKEVKKRILLGTFVLSAGYFDAYYSKAQKLRKLIKTETESILSTYNYIVCPTAPTTAWDIGGKADSLSMYLADLFTVQASLCGLPAISIPNGEDNSGMPIGLQVIGKAFDEENLYAFSDYLDKL